MPHRRGRGIFQTGFLPFDGGINFADQAIVRANQHVAGRNWWLDRDAVVRPRPGNRIYNTTPVTGPAQGLWEYRRISDQINRLMLFAGGVLYKGNDVTRSFSSLVSGLSTTAQAWAANEQDLFWWCDAVDTPRVTDATNVFRIGIVNPSAAPTVALVAVAGNLPAEDHFYRYTYVREETGVKVRESNPSAESTKVTNTAGSGQNDVTVVASSDAQVTHIYIYRRSSLTVPEHKFVGKTTNVNGTFRDNVAVASLGAIAFWEESGGLEDHGYPPNGIFGILTHRDGRMYAWGPSSRLFYTRTLAPANWPGASGGATGTAAVGITLIIGADDGDEGQALISEADAVLCIKRRNVYRLVGSGPDQDDGTLGDWLSEKLPTHFGCAARLSAAAGPAGVFWLSDDGPVRVDQVRTGLPRLIGTELVRNFIAESDDLTKAVGYVWGPYYFLFLPFGGLFEGIVWCALNGSWWRITEMDARALVSREDETLVWAGKIVGETAVKVYEFDRAINDNGATVIAELTTRIHGVDPGRQKLAAVARIHCESRPGQELRARLIPDQSGSYVERQLKLAGRSGARIVKDFPGTKRLQGGVFQLYLKSANGGSRPAIYGWELDTHIFNRSVSAPTAIVFADTFTDPTPDVGIVFANNMKRVWDQLL